MQWGKGAKNNFYFVSVFEGLPPEDASCQKKPRPLLCTCIKLFRIFADVRKRQADRLLRES